MGGAPISKWDPIGFDPQPFFEGTPPSMLMFAGDSEQLCCKRRSLQKRSTSWVWQQVLEHPGLTKKPSPRESTEGFF